MIGSKIDDNKAFAMHSQGMTDAEIAAELGCSAETLHKKFTRHGCGEKRKIVYAPAPILFNLKVGDIVSAYEPEISAVRHNYTVIAIYRHVYICRRVNGWWTVAFLIKDYGRKSDSGRVKLVRCLN